MHSLNVLPLLLAFPILPSAWSKPTANAVTSCPHGGSYYLRHHPQNKNEGNGSYAFLENSGYYAADNNTSYYIQFGVNDISQASKFRFVQSGSGYCFLSVLPSAAIPDTTNYRAGALVVSGYRGELDTDSYVFMFPPGEAFDGRQVHANCTLGAHSYLNCSALSKNPTQTLNILNLIGGSVALTSGSDRAYPLVNITAIAA